MFCSLFIPRSYTNWVFCHLHFALHTKIFKFRSINVITPKKMNSDMVIYSVIGLSLYQGSIFFSPLIYNFKHHGLVCHWNFPKVLPVFPFDKKHLPILIRRAQYPIFSRKETSGLKSSGPTEQKTFPSYIYSKYLQSGLKTNES